MSSWWLTCWVDAQKDLTAKKIKYSPVSIIEGRSAAPAISHGQVGKFGFKFIVFKQTFSSYLLNSAVVLPFLSQDSMGFQSLFSSSQKSFCSDPIVPPPNQVSLSIVHEYSSSYLFPPKIPGLPLNEGSSTATHPPCHFVPTWQNLCTSLFADLEVQGIVKSYLSFQFRSHPFCQYMLANISWPWGITTGKI